eukprot:TRINITY_DN1306_c0_g1_i1.p1 TRINITY_DN1306_c0_g1~~TRINITY_DN1306_c0_g1_i1.p1  ORF type:complete len:365 (+),score=12.41 TRINITY_DN1306_c0_g1_i1:70-1164(+)
MGNGLTAATGHPSAPWCCCVACDLVGEKINVRLTFPSKPTLPQLTRETVQVLTPEKARASDAPFSVESFRIYDDLQHTWSILLSDLQLYANCQLYVFQPEAHGQDAPGDIPPPVDAMDSDGAVLSGTCCPADVKARSVFRDLDVAGKGFVDAADVRLALCNGPGKWRGGLRPSMKQAALWFAEAEMPGTGRVRWSSFLRFARLYPAAIDALFRRASDTYVHGAASEADMPGYMHSTESKRWHTGQALVDSVAARRFQELVAADPVRLASSKLEEHRLSGSKGSSILSQTQKKLGDTQHTHSARSARSSRGGPQRPSSPPAPPPPAPGSPPPPAYPSPRCWSEYDRRFAAGDVWPLSGPMLRSFK